MASFTNKDFEYSDNLLTQDISYLESVLKNRGEEPKVFHELSSNRTGLSVMSIRTGDVVDMAITRVDKNGNDIVGWYLKPTSESLSKLNSAARVATSDLGVLIVNS